MRSEPAGANGNASSRAWAPSKRFTLIWRTESTYCSASGYLYFRVLGAIRDIDSKRF